MMEIMSLWPAKGGGFTLDLPSVPFMFYYNFIQVFTGLETRMQNPRPHSPYAEPFPAYPYYEGNQSGSVLPWF
jgi:hypothetical protein